jgi:tetratricopeptide (TPR) repeat protein/transglutaminase-like putative cysteine protease
MRRHPTVFRTPARRPSGRLAVGLLAAALIGTALPARAASAPDEAGPIPVRPGATDPVLGRVAELRSRLVSRLDRPGAAADVLELHALHPHVGHLERLADALGLAAWSGRAHPEVRALAKWLLADIERRRGRVPRMAARLDELGTIRDVAFVGPFDNENKTGFHVAYGPEKALDLAQPLAGLRTEVRWRTVPGLGDTGTIRLGEAVRPDRDVVVYALAVLHAPAAGPAVLHLGASGATKVWLDGQPVLVDPTYHPARFGQRRVPVQLRRGENVLLVKLAAADAGPLELILQVTRPDGQPIRGLRTTAPEAGTFRAPRPAPKQAFGPGETPLLAALRAAAAGGGRALFDHARVLAFRRSFDDTEKLHVRAAERAARALPGDVDAQLLAAALELDDGNLRRTYLEAAVRAERPGEARAHAALATHWLEQGFPERALDTIEAGRRAAPGDHRAVPAHARALDGVGFYGRSKALLREAVRAWPHLPSLQKEWARALRRDGDHDGAVTALRVALGLHPADSDAAGTLASLLADRGDIPGAVQALEGAERFRPVDPDLLVRRAELLAANGRIDRARPLFRRAVAVCPQEADFHERLGRAELRAGDTAAALAAFEAGLAVSPQRASLRELIRALTPGAASWARPYLIDLDEAVRAAEGKWEGEDAVGLVDLTAVRVLPSGQTSRTRQVIRRLDTQRGVDGARFSVRYAPEREEVRVERARIRKADGTLVDGHVENDHSMNDSWSGLYYDARVRSIGFPGLVPGDTVELVYRVDDVARDNLLSDYFGDVNFVQDVYPTARWEYVLEMPAGRPIYANDPAPASHTKTPTASGGELHRWTARDVPRFVPEPGMPGWVEVAPYLHVSTYRDWESVARFWWGLVRDQVRPTPAIRAQAEQIVAGIPARDVEGRVRAVYDWVVTKTRYVGLEFGIHSFKPYPVERILERRFGDCKDKASLVHSLLESLGIESRLVLLRMRNLGRIGAEPASLAVFNHAVLYVPSLDLYLDGTAEWSGTRELPAADRGAEVLVVNPGGTSEFRVTPEAPADLSTHVAADRVVLLPDGSARIDGEARIAGLGAQGYRRSYAAPHGRTARAEGEWARTFPGASVEKFDISDPTDIERDVSLRYRVAVPRYAEANGEALAFTPFGTGSGYVEGYAPLSSRKTDLVLAYASTRQFRYEVALPEGFVPASLPAPVEEEGPFGRVRVVYRHEGGKLLAEGEVVLAKPRIAPAEYPAFREFLGRVDRALKRRVVLAPAAGTETSAAR